MERGKAEDRKGKRSLVVFPLENDILSCTLFSNYLIISRLIKMNGIALSVWLSWLEHHPIHQRVLGLIPGQGTYGVFRPSPVQAHTRGNPFMSMLLSHTDVSLFLSLSVPPSLSLTNQ